MAIKVKVILMSRPSLGQSHFKVRVIQEPNGMDFYSEADGEPSTESILVDIYFRISRGFDNWTNMKSRTVYISTSK